MSVHSVYNLFMLALVQVKVLVLSRVGQMHAFSLVVSTVVRSLLSPGSQKRVLNFQFPMRQRGPDSLLEVSAF